MLDTTTPSIMDPSTPGMTKQTMLDWLRITFPKSPVSSQLNKADVAVIVRKKQPQLFPDPNSNKPALAAPVLDIVEPPQDSVPVLSIQSQSVAVQVKAHVKRSASPCPNPKPVKRTNLGDEELLNQIQIPSSSKRKEKKNSYFDLGRPLVLSPETSNAGKYNPGIDLMERDSKQDLKALKNYEVAPGRAATNLKVKVFSSSNTDQFKTILPVAAELPDLISFSDMDLLAVDDLEIGEKVTSHSSSTSIYKSGVDIFKEERLCVAKVGVLEESVSSILNRIGLIEKASGNNNIKHEQDKYELGT
ncbi:uncharacterized protein MELLADRAFT_94678 [Melampsora larici-populina 98AG31]|uniref:Uncharacterized protein n=1 Tax=Melampsora larici-populina (strain 98AG31 / pathotype 3-4-7) TaxID=747676 RepID=F4S7J9_MELLP|nr:uncharacterized protein MELLADRAFT_94678 [Melampsora larici-populina 98AG31]EGF99379.1 hypothetical protein MELLADRAFT_94678 [Melampsora larici-populina 98AG31]